MRRFLLGLLILASVLLQGAVEQEGIPAGRTAFRSYGVEKGLGNLSVMALLQDRDGYLWVATEDGLYRYDGRDFQRFDRRQGLPSSYSNVLHQGADGTFWVGTFAGLTRRVGAGFELVRADQGLPTEHVDAMAGTPDGCTWIGQVSGLYFTRPGGAFQKAPAWPGQSATALVVDGEGCLWAGSSSNSEGTPSRVYQRDGQAWRGWDLPGLERARVDAIQADGAGRIWVRCSTRLWVLEKGGTAFHLSDLPERVASPRGGRLSLDRRGRLMVPAGTGLFLHRERLAAARPSGGPAGGMGACGPGGP